MIDELANPVWLLCDINAVKEHTDIESPDSSYHTITIVLIYYHLLFWCSKYIVQVAEVAGHLLGPWYILSLLSPFFSGHFSWSTTCTQTSTSYTKHNLRKFHLHLSVIWLRRSWVTLVACRSLLDTVVTFQRAPVVCPSAHGHTIEKHLTSISRWRKWTGALASRAVS